MFTEMLRKIINQEAETVSYIASLVECGCAVHKYSMGPPRLGHGAVNQETLFIRVNVEALC